VSREELLTLTGPRSRDLTRRPGHGRAHDALDASDVALSLAGTRQLAYAAARWRVAGDALALPVLQRELREVVAGCRRGRRPLQLEDAECERLVGVAIGLERRRISEEALQAMFNGGELRWQRVLRPALAELERSLESWHREAAGDMDELLAEPA